MALLPSTDSWSWGQDWFLEHWVALAVTAKEVAVSPAGIVTEPLIDEALTIWTAWPPEAALSLTTVWY